MSAKPNRRATASMSTTSLVVVSWTNYIHIKLDWKVFFTWGNYSLRRSRPLAPWPWSMRVSWTGKSSACPLPTPRLWPYMHFTTTQLLLTNSLLLLYWRPKTSLENTLIRGGVVLTTTLLKTKDINQSLRLMVWLTSFSSTNYYYFTEDPRHQPKPPPNGLTDIV